VTAVKKFTDHSAAARRIWQAIQNLEPLPEPAPPPAGRKPLWDVTRQNSKKARVLEMLGRTEGATVKEIMLATAWQPHYADVRIMPTCVGNPVCGAGIAAMESA
jgi:hypothetical protein